MATPTPSSTVMDREFLGIRSRLIDLAAALDRIDRSGEKTADDLRMAHIRRSLEILLGDKANRAERIQIEFSLPYEENWRSG